MSKTSIQMQWCISEEKLKSVPANGYLSSDHFYSGLPFVKYFLMLFPNGFPASENGQFLADKVCIFLHLEMVENRKLHAEYTIAVHAAGKVLQSEHEFIKEENGSIKGWGMMLCTKEELYHKEKRNILRFLVPLGPEYLDDGKLTIELEATLEDRGLITTIPKIANLYDLLWSKDDKEFAFLVENKEVKVHKIILEARSDVFKAMLSPHTVEFHQNKVTIIDFLYETIQLAIKYCYNQDISAQINDDNAFDLLRFADKYNIEGFQEFIVDVLITKIWEINVIDYANMAAIFNLKRLEEYCLAYLFQASKKCISVENLDNLDSCIAVELEVRNSLPLSETL